MSEFSIICAIEAGRLEAKTLLMLRTLKNYAGELGNCPVVAFQGRSGDRISAATHAALVSLDVEYVYQPDLNHAPWFNYTNKIAAVRYAQDTFTSPWRIWLDSDILFLDEPSYVQKGRLKGTDFHARFEYLPPAMAATEDTRAAYWARVCSLCGVQLDHMGYYDLDLPRKRMKPYFNSGTFLWRAETDFADHYIENFYRLLGAKISPKNIGPWFADQAALTPVLAQMALAWRMLPVEDHLMLFEGAAQHQDFLNVLPRANLVHYSKARNRPDAAAFDGLLLQRHPDLEHWLQEHDEFQGIVSPGLVSKSRKLLRRLRQSAYARSCQEL